jgi:hypothetical protein
LPKLLVAALAALWLLRTDVPPAATELRVLFIGNSLTSVNDLPSLVKNLGAADGVKIRTGTVAMNDFGLAEHWNDGRAAREIRKGGWDFVVLQQGPSALPESRVVLREQAARFAPLIRAAGARPALYMVWPSRQRSGDFDRVSGSYAIAAADVDAVLLPAGEAWRAMSAHAPDATLYAADEFHPSPDGSWLAALVIYCGLAGRAPSAITKFPGGFPRNRELFVGAALSALNFSRPAAGRPTLPPAIRAPS